MDTNGVVWLNPKLEPVETELTLTSSDPSKLLLSRTPDVPGTPSIKLTVRPRFRESQDFWLHALGDFAIPVVAVRTGPGVSEELGYPTLEAICELFPSFRRLRMLRNWGGIVDVTPDRSPIIGRAPVPGLRTLLNLNEYVVHHEDIRRAQPGWEPRELPPEDVAKVKESYTGRYMKELLVRRERGAGVRKKEAAE